MTALSVRQQIVRGTLASVILLGAVLALAGGEFLVHRVPHTGAFARVWGDPAVRLAGGTALPAAPDTAPLYTASLPLRARQLQGAMGHGRVRGFDDWLSWSGRSAVDPVAVMGRLQPGVVWRSQRRGEAVYVFPDGATGAMATGPLTGYTASPTLANVYATFLQDPSDPARITHVWMPATTIRRSGQTALISAEQAFADLKHHRDNAYPMPNDVVPAVVRWWRGGQLPEPLAAIDRVELVHAADPQEPRVSVPVWVFGDAGQVIAVR